MNYKIILTLTAIIAVVAVAVPVDSNYTDLYVKLTVQKPLIGDAKITGVEVEQAPHTLLQIPQLRPASLHGSGVLKVRLETETAGTSISLREVWRSGSDMFRFVLPSVPVSDTKLTVLLYEDNIQTDERTVILEAS